MKFLVDTNILSETRRGARGNVGVHAWANSIDERDLLISVITIKEIEVGILHKSRTDPAQALGIRRWLEQVVLPRYADRILSVDVAVARQAAALDVPDRRPTADGLIAATALVHGLTVVTRNTVDFLPTGVPLLNPWQPA